MYTTASKKTIKLFIIIPIIVAILMLLGPVAQSSNTPAAPENLRATSGNQQVTLTWDDPGDSTITEYEVRVCVRREPCNDWETVSGSGADTTQHTINSLVNEKTYAFKIRAVNENGEGDSVKINKKPSARAAMTSAPPADTTPTFGVVELMPPFSYAVNEEITPIILPEASGGDGTLQYQVTPALPEGLVFDASARTISGTPSAIMPTTQYTLEVSDSDANNDGSDTAQFAFTLKVVSQPDIPTNLRATSGNQQVTLAWDAPVRTSAVEEYHLQICTVTDNTCGDWLWNEGWGSAETTTVTIATSDEVNLQNSVEYLIYLRAQNVAGTAVSAVKTTPTDSDPVTTDALPIFFGEIEIADQYVSVGEKITPITLPEASGGTGTLTYVITESLPAGIVFDATTRTISGTPEMPAQKSIYTLKVTDADENTAETDTATVQFSLEVVQPQQAPAQPQQQEQQEQSAAQPQQPPKNIRSSAGDGQVTLRWDAPETPTSITRYEVQQCIGRPGVPCSAWNAIAGSTATTVQHTLTNLENGVMHTFRVRAVTDTGNGRSAQTTAIPTATVTNS